MRALLALLVLLAAGAAPAAAATAKKPWPPATGPGHVFAHYGEEHINDIDGPEVLPKVVADVVRYRPDLVTMSGDKADDGKVPQLEAWRAVMAAYDEAGIPYMAGVGNHDGEQPTPEAVTEVSAGSTPLRDIRHYLDVFASRPYPMGDAAPYERPLMAPKARPQDDPRGASTHFFVDYANVRFVFLDNSCFGIVNCDPVQNPPDGQGRSQYAFLRDAAAGADREGKLLFVVMHMPTRDPRDQRNAYSTSVNHVMGKGISPDNQIFEQEAERLGVDAVLLGHIKGQFQYVGLGGIPYYVDGGAGGELYSAGPLGVDHGYWYGWRLLRVDGTTITTDTVPVIVPGGMTLEGPERLAAGAPPVRYEGHARQPATKSDRAVVERLELRDPDPTPRSQSGGVPGWLVWLAPLGLVAVLAVGAGALRSPRPRLARAGAVALAGAVGAAGAVGVAAAQRSAPEDTPREALPNPARIFTSANPLVLAPVASDSDDPRRNVATQTADGAFRPVCPGRATLTLTSGFEETSRRVHVASGPGPIVRSIRRRARTVRRGRTAIVAAVRLAQPAIVDARLRRGRRTVEVLLGRECMQAGARAVRLRAGRGIRRGAYRLEIRVRSDRRTVVRRHRVVVR